MSTLNGYRIRIVVMKGGERLPLLVGRDGVPLFRPMVWLLTMRRSVNVASATLKANLIALRLLHMWADERKVDIEARMLAGNYFSLAEGAALGDAVKHSIWSLDEGDEVEGKKGRRGRKPMKLKPGMLADEVDSGTAARRLRTIIDYLEWLAQDGLSRQEPKAAELWAAAKDRMVADLRARIPTESGRDQVGRREAPPEEAMDALLRLVEPDDSRNPWGNIGLRVRNRLLVHVLLGFGIRRGEALGIRIDRIDFQANRILIARSADDPLDTRKDQPLAKTRDRWLPMAEGLASMVHDYVVHVRKKLPKARKHPFLFVSHRDGAPLSLISVNKLFQSLRERFPELPTNLTAHLLRHAWNEAFSKRMDAQGVEAAREEEIRSEIMGWSPTSGTAATYTRRHTRERAEQMALEHQKAITRKKGDA
jgi:integrase